MSSSRLIKGMLAVATGVFVGDAIAFKIIYNLDNAGIYRKEADKLNNWQIFTAWTLPNKKFLKTFEITPNALLKSALISFNSKASPQLSILSERKKGEMQYSTFLKLTQESRSASTHSGSEQEKSKNWVNQNRSIK